MKRGMVGLVITCGIVSIAERRWPQFIFRWRLVLAWQDDAMSGGVLAMLENVPL